MIATVFILAGIAAAIYNQRRHGHEAPRHDVELDGL